MLPLHKEIETEFPGWTWLVRNRNGRYWANLIGCDETAPIDDRTPTYSAYGATPDEAIKLAYALLRGAALPCPERRVLRDVYDDKTCNDYVTSISDYADTEFRRLFGTEQGAGVAVVAALIRPLRIAPGQSQVFTEGALVGNKDQVAAGLRVVSKAAASMLRAPQPAANKRPI